MTEHAAPDRFARADRLIGRALSLAIFAALIVASLIAIGLAWGAWVTGNTVVSVVCLALGLAAVALGAWVLRRKTRLSDYHLND